VHELIRTTLVTDLSLPRRQRLHLKIADALERLRAASLESHASVLAHHLYQAGAAAETGRTARFLLLAARGQGATAGHVWRGMLAECEAPLSRALDALTSANARERALLLSQLGWRRLTAGRVDGAWQCIDEASALAERVGDSFVDARVMTARAYGHRFCAEYEAASVTARRALPATRGGSAWGVADLLLNARW